MSKPKCAVRGMPHPGAMCSRVIVGGKLCGYTGSCEHQRQQPGPSDDAKPVMLHGTLMRCLSCGGRHVINGDGTPAGGALPCGG